MEERYKPVECYGTGDTFDHLAFGGARVLDQLVANEIGQKELVGAGACEVMVKVEL